MKRLTDFYPIFRRGHHRLQSERGSSTVETLGLMTVVVILFLAVVVFLNGSSGGQIGQATLDVMEQMIASIGGGGVSPGTASVPGADVPEAALPEAALTSIGVPQLVETGVDSPGETAPEGDDGGGGILGQIGGFFVGIGEGVVDTVTGIVTLAWDGIRLAPITGDIYGIFDPEGRAEVQDRYAALGEALWNDPLGTLGQMLEALVEPITTDWGEGRYGEAIGRSIFEIALFFVPGDEVGRVGTVGRIGSGAARIDQMLPDELLTVLARADRLTPDELAALTARLDSLTPEEMADLLQRIERMTPEELERLGLICSFSSETLVATAGGLKAISTLRSGDYVLAYDEVTKAVDFYPVIAVWAHQDTVIEQLVINGERIETTPDHPFYTVEGEWVAAGMLQVGDRVYQANGDSLDTVGVVQATERLRQTQPMYNLTVATAHTYFVGEGQWLVHNACNFSLLYQRLNNMTPEEFSEFISHLDELSPEQLRALRNYRSRWEEFAGRLPYRDEFGAYNIHHGFPRDFRDWFYQRGIDIDNPQYMYELPQSLHTRLPDGVHTGPYPNSWNGRWEDWINTHPNATLEEIMAFRDQLAREFGIEDYLGHAPDITPPNVPPRITPDDD